VQQTYLPGARSDGRIALTAQILNKERGSVPDLDVLSSPTSSMPTAKPPLMAGLNLAQFKKIHFFH
jgi:hypothetical protein